jgi:hypothetical protein
MALPINIDRSKIIANIATLFSGSIVAQGMTALTLLLTARQLQVDSYGQYAACITLTSMLSILFSLGLDIWLLREGGKAPHQIGDLAGSVLGVKGGNCLIPGGTIIRPTILSYSHSTMECRFALVGYSVRDLSNSI